ncbi:VWA domain-containing protein [Telmatobacter sp. DSM 110680]|uniref:VWA domain-containing protein n=1 Tax=Telmatobacter sp. DSM 110680 TaxID=3036704 RepID=A0AAU7DQF4_9BACT
MRWILISMFLAMMTLPSWAAKRMTVAQLDQMLVTARAAHKSDIEIARRIGDVDLSERLTDIALGRLNKQFAASSQPAIALLLLADRSAFLDPPASELPTTPPPDAVAQQHLLEAAKRFAVETLPHLPNLLATRTTFSFDDSPQEVTKGGYLQRIGLHLIGSSKEEVSVRNEKENPSTRTETTGTGAASSPARGGLITWGEFGSTLLIILSDSGEGEMRWSNWEQTASGVLAVFHYQVPKAASHYEIDTPVEEIEPNAGSNRWARAGGTTAMVRTAMVRSKPAYQGSLWIDPASGTILRVTLVADLKGNSTIERGAILVDYGPVPIADRTVICPMRSLALSSAPATVNATLKGTATEWLNENLFSDYHMFASTSRILDEQSTASTLPLTPSPASELNDQTWPVAGQASNSETSGFTPVPEHAAAPSTNLPSNAPATTPAGKAERPAANASGKASDSLSDQRPTAVPAAAALSTATSTTSQPQPSSTTLVSPPSKVETQYSAPSIEINVNRILVPVVVRDKEGRTVSDLKEEDFQVFDEGKPRSISAFTVEERAPAKSESRIAEPNQQAPTQGNAASQSSVLPERVTVFLFDDMHLTYDDMNYVQKAASNALDGTIQGSDIAAVVSISGKINSGLTRDRVKLQDAIMSLRPQGIYRTDKGDCPKIDYYQADLIENKRDPAALKDVIDQIMIVCNPKTPEGLAERLADSAAMRTLNLGKQDILSTYATIREIVRRMATLPGQRTLVLVSDGLLPVEQEARFAESQVIDFAEQSNVIVNAIDARGLYTASMTAGDDTRQRNPTQISDYRRASMKLAEDSMGELTDGTGGTFFNSNNDLNAGFKAITKAPEVVYMLELPLNSVRANGRYHRLEVKLDRKGMKVQARRGYFVPKPEKRKE